jgi:hypothetical protein
MLDPRSETSLSVELLYLSAPDAVGLALEMCEVLAPRVAHRSKCVCISYT